MKFLTFLFTSCLFLSTAALWARDTEIVNGRPVVAKQAIIKVDAYKAGVPLATALKAISALANADDLRLLVSTTGHYVIHSKTANVTALLNVLKSHAAVSLAEPDYMVSISTTPNDPSFSSQVDMYNPSTIGADIGATLAWGVSTGGTANVVGVVDTGIDYNHPDLAANVWSAPSSFSVTLSWGTLTCPAGSHGYNAVTRTCTPLDDNGHGTHVSGTIGAVGNNGIGVAGVNWTTQIMGLKFLDAGGNGATSDAVDAIEFALQAKSKFPATANLRVLSNSWGGPDRSQSLLDEINKANVSDVLFVAAAGNSSSNNDTTPFYPASFNVPNVISVAATTSSDTLASFSNHGTTSVQLAAPGVNILSTYPNNSYAYLTGTSMAAPHVSGAAMLVLSKCSINTTALRANLLNNVDLVPGLTGSVSTGGRLDVNRSLRSCANIPSNDTATFVKTDTTTAGTWKSVYGADGYSVIGDSASIPSYVTMTPTSVSQYTWAPSTTDPRALQKASGSDRIAACWYTSGSFTVNLKFGDTSPHQVAFYALDWDTSNGRVDKFEILDSFGNILDARTVSNFTNGSYLVWNLSGNVTVRVSNFQGVNAVMSGIFFGGAGSSVTSSGTASFVKTDNSTIGSWKGVYGTEGYNVINDTTAYPSYATVTPSGIASYSWASSTSDPRALQKGSSTTDRIASCWYTSSSMSMDLNFSDTNPHQVALYMLDWDTANVRVQKIDVLDSAGNVLDTRNVSSFSNGTYLVWNLKGHVVLRVTNASGSNAVVSGLFFGMAGTSSSGTASFVKTDAATSGNWKTVYGLDGYSIINDTTAYPSYVTVTPSSIAPYTWASSTTASRALQKASSTTDRIAACWYATTSFSIDLQFGDGNTHQTSLYLLDYDTSNARIEKVDVLDAAGNLLDSRTASNFSNGAYLVWNLSGHVVLRVTPSTANAVVSGLFFR